jgi:hypothetical protein
METAEVERELEELETRIERLRALYEQYFMGIEKLEPLVPRKDVERRIWVLRREQIRNTGLRFKFQMLVQRFNTFQQYWGRVTREIENGTYRRDVIRAARRFGAKEALTILGRKRAERFAALAAAQEGRRGAGHDEGALEELSDDYLEEVSDEEELLLESNELKPYDDGEAELGLENEVFDEDEPPTIDRARYKELVGPLPPPRLPPLLATPPPAMPLDQPTGKALANEPGGVVPPVSLSPAAGAGAGKSAGRYAPPPRPSDPEAAKRRVAELAAQVKAPRDQSSEIGVDAGPLELDFDVEAPKTTRKASGSTKPPPRRASSVKMGSVKQPPAAPPGAHSRAGKDTSRAASKSTSTLPALKETGGAGKTAPAARGAQERQESAGLEDKRLRQIYAKYMETKRATNEPTAGITFEKLAASLRAQADKLRQSHPAKSVDYDVVIKDGKTLLKPILR